MKDAKGNPLANQVVDIIIIDSNGSENHQQVTTDGSGHGMLQLNGLTPGEYTFNVTYGGSNNYKDSAIAKKITVASQVTSSSNSGSDTQSGWYDSKGVYHFYENEKEYVGSRNGQHMDIETANYVREHGMA